MSDTGDLLYRIGGNNPTYTYPSPPTPPEKASPAPATVYAAQPPGKKLPKSGYDVDPGAFSSKPASSPNLWHQFLDSLKQYPETLWQDVAGTGRDFQAMGGGGQKQAPPTPAKPADPAPQNPLLAFLLGKIGALNYGQINNPTQALVGQLSQDVSGMSPGDAAKLLGALPGQLGKDVTKATGPPSPNDALTMGLQMFFSQYLAPQIAQINQANQSAMGSINANMQNALSQNLPPGVKQAVEGYTPIIAGLTNQLNNAAGQAALQMGPFTAMLQGLGANTAALQGLEGAIPKAAATQMFGAGTGGQLGTLYGNLIGQDSLFGMLAPMLLGTNAGTGLPGLPGVSPQNQQSQQPLDPATRQQFSIFG